MYQKDDSYYREKVEEFKIKLTVFIGVTIIAIIIWSSI